MSEITLEQLKSFVTTDQSRARIAQLVVTGDMLAATDGRVIVFGSRKLDPDYTMPDGWEEFPKFVDNYLFRLRNQVHNTSPQNTYLTL